MARWLPDHPHFDPVPKPAWERVEYGHLPGNPLLPDATRPKLSEHHIRALAEYSDEESFPLNEMLRTPWKRADRKFVDRHRSITDAFTRAPVMDHPVIVFRQLEIPTGYPVMPVLRKLRSMPFFRLPGHQSTSTSRATWWPRGPHTRKYSVGLIIRARHGLDLLPYSKTPEEDELLLPHNSKFRVLGIHDAEELGKRLNRILPMPRFVAHLEQVV